MPDRKQFKLQNGDRIAIYKPLRGLNKSDRAKHQALVDAAERRNAKRTWEDNKPLTKVPWGFLLLWALMILL